MDYTKEDSWNCVVQVWPPTNLMSSVHSYTYNSAFGTIYKGSALYLKPSCIEQQQWFQSWKRGKNELDSDRLFFYHYKKHHISAFREQQFTAIFQVKQKDWFMSAGSNPNPPERRTARPNAIL